MPTFAAVDIGSNSVRLKIAKSVRGRLQTLHEDREVTRLGESVFANGSLDPQAMSLTIKVLQRFHRAVQTFAADRVRVVATAALRDSRVVHQPGFAGRQLPRLRRNQPLFVPPRSQSWSESSPHLPRQRQPEHADRN